jgi:hypothetical protein
MPTPVPKPIPTTVNTYWFSRHLFNSDPRWSSSVSDGGEEGEEDDDACGDGGNGGDIGSRRTSKEEEEWLRCCGVTMY